MPNSQPIRKKAPATGLVARLRDGVFQSRRRFATGLIALLAVAIGFHVIFGQNGLTAYQRKRMDAQILTQQMSDLQRENADLQGHVDRLQKDPSAIEHQAREALHYTRPGEVIYTLPPDPPSATRQ